MLPTLSSYDEQLPFDAAAAGVAATALSAAGASVLPPLVVHVSSPSSAASSAAAAASPLSPELAEMAAMRAELAASRELSAKHEAEMTQVKADAEAHRKALAATKADIKKLQDASSSSIDAGDGLAYAAASASPLSPTQQREADERSRLHQQRQVDALTAHILQLHQRVEDLEGGGRWQDAELAAAEQSKEESALRKLKAELRGAKKANEPSV